MKYPPEKWFRIYVGVVHGSGGVIDPAKASSILNLLELLINLMVAHTMFLFALSSRESFPWSKRWHNEGSSNAEDGPSNISLVLLRRTNRGTWKRGQRKKKCSGVSSSMPQIHLGSRQLNCFEKRCDLRSL